MRNPIDPTLIQSATVRAQNAASRFTESCSGSGCSCEAHQEFKWWSDAIREAENYPNTIKNDVEGIEANLRFLNGVEG